MLQIRDELKRKGYEVSMDERRTEKFPSKTAADAVEKSAAVLIAVSRKYKESPDCFAGITVIITANCYSMSCRCFIFSEVCWKYSP